MKKTKVKNKELFDLGAKVDQENFLAKTKREAFVPRAIQLLIKAENSSQVIEIFRTINSQDFMHIGSLSGGIKGENFNHRVDGGVIKKNYGATSTIMHRIGEFSAAKLKYIENREQESKNFVNEYGLLKQKVNKDYKEGFNFQELNKNFENFLEKQPNTNKIEQLRIVSEMSQQLVVKVNQAWEADFKDYSELRQAIADDHSLRHVSNLCDNIEALKSSSSSEEQLKQYKETLSRWNQIVQSVLAVTPKPFGTSSSISSGIEPVTEKQADNLLKLGMLGVNRYPKPELSVSVIPALTKTASLNPG